MENLAAERGLKRRAANRLKGGGRLLFETHPEPTKKPLVLEPFAFEARAGAEEGERYR